MTPASKVISLPRPGARVQLRVEPMPDADIQAAMRAAQENLLRLQDANGHWCCELFVDSTLCSDYVLFMHWRGKVDRDLQEKCVAHIRRRQLADGGWNIFDGGPSEINACVKAYFALKLAGHRPSDTWMVEARANILRLGGIPRMNTFSKLYLALLGQFPWQYVPIIPVEVVLMPDWMYFNIYEMSSWSRAMLMPLAIINHYKPTRHLPEHLQLHELYPVGTEDKDFSLPRDPRFFAWKNFFLRWDSILKSVDDLPWRPLRERALRKALAWMTERMGEGSDGLAAIFPAMLNALIALEAAGVPEDSPVYQKATKDFEGLFVHDPEDFRIQPCLSPVWDTAINMIALAESGLEPTHPALRKAAAWLYGKEVRLLGDWTRQNSHPEASGWAFEYNNIYYPDTDDTMMVLMALRHVSPEDKAAAAACFKRALPWLLSFQCEDGGWAAFDKDVTKHWLEHMPFADHNAILDPTCSDLTARVLELLGYLGFSRDLPFVQRAIKHLQRTQEDDGSWYGRWGVNYIYGTWQVLRGLRSIGLDMRADWIQRGRDWLESCQNEDGGWGETASTYDDAQLKGKGPSTASQTAWALMGLIACGDLSRASIQRGLDYLMSTQVEDGSWKEPWTTGTGFPRVFYLRYDSYRNNWPLLAMATYLNEKNRVFRPTQVEV